MAKIIQNPGISEYPNSFKRQGAFPLDVTSIKYGTTDKTSNTIIDEYAKSETEGAYVGQIVAGVDNDTVTSVKVIVNKTGSTEELLNPLPIKRGSTGTDSLQVATCNASGNYSFAVGDNTTASNSWAYAEGFGSQATGMVSHAEGQGTEASAIRAHAEGYTSKATGDTSHAEGWITVASGRYSHTEGENTEATGQSSHAEGRDTHAQGGCSHTEGDQTYAVSNHCHAEGFGSIAGKASGLTIGGSYDLTVGIYSHAEGNGTYAEGNSSHAEGCRTKALGRGSHAEGWETVATETGTFSHVEGHSSQAQGNVSHAEGWGTIASGTAAHSEGRSTNATGSFSHASGIGTNATAEAQTAIGKYNEEESKALFIVGNGYEGSNNLVRRNLFSVGDDSIDYHYSPENYIKLGSTKISEHSLAKLNFNNINFVGNLQFTYNKQSSFDDTNTLGFGWFGIVNASSQTNIDYEAMIPLYGDDSNSDSTSSLLETGKTYLLNVHPENAEIEYGGAIFYSWEVNILIKIPDWGTLQSSNQTFILGGHGYGGLCSSLYWESPGVWALCLYWVNDNPPTGIQDGQGIRVTLL